jgi:hypothetical protein
VRCSGIFKRRSLERSNYISMSPGPGPQEQPQPLPSLALVSHVPSGLSSPPPSDVVHRETLTAPEPMLVLCLDTSSTVS